MMRARRETAAHPAGLAIVVLDVLLLAVDQFGAELFLPCASADLT